MKPTVEIALPSETLGELAAQINAAHEAGERAAVTGLEHFRSAGEALLKAKARCGHGRWLKWLEKNVRFDRRTATNYMRLAAKWETVSHLEGGLTDALKLLTDDDDGSDERGEPPTAHVAHNSGNNEWYTPPEYIAAARAVMGGIDLDPASSEKAQEIVEASEYFTADDDGLSQPWAGRVWLNPPYAAELVDKFVGKLCSHVEAGEVAEAILLTNNSTDTAWWQQASRVASAACFPLGRVKFLDTDGNPGAPLQGQAALYFGSNPERFMRLFSQFGTSAEFVPNLHEPDT